MKVTRSAVSVILICISGCVGPHARSRSLPAPPPDRLWSDDIQRYHARLESTAGRKQVFISRSSGDLFGMPFDVEILDDLGRVERRGSLVAMEGDIPYCVVEVKSDSTALPRGARGEWLLAIGFWPREQTHTEGEPVDFLPWDPPESNELYIYAEPVDWLDDDVVFDHGTGRLADVARLQARFAEAGPSPLANLSHRPREFVQPELSGLPVPLLRFQRLGTMEISRGTFPRPRVLERPRIGDSSLLPCSITVGGA